MGIGAMAFSRTMWRYLPLLFVFGCTPARAPTADLDARLARIDAGGVLGASVLHIESGQRSGTRSTERFKLHSVMKLPLAIAVLDRVDHGADALDATVTFTAADLRDGPANDLGDRYPQGATLPLAELVREVVQRSDNTACDVLLARIGGPANVVPAVTKKGPLAIDVHRSEGEITVAEYGVPYTAETAQRDAVRALDTKVGADVHRKARAEVVADPWDTATPEAMVELLARLERGELLSAASTRWLLDTLAGTTTGPHRLRAGIPSGVPLLHKTGTGSSFADRRDAIGDVGLVTLPDGTHLAIATFVANASTRDDKAEAAMAAVARAAWDAYAGARPATSSSSASR